MSGHWKDAALCAETDPDAFFPDKGHNATPAKRICNGTERMDPCPVKAQCLAYALDSGQAEWITFTYPDWCKHTYPTQRAADVDWDGELREMTE